MNQWISKFKSKPKWLFLLDGLGASLTALVFGGLLIPFYQELGMPVFALKLLFLVALVFAAYSLACYFFLKTRLQLFLRIIAVGNSIYCCLTLFFVLTYFRELHIIGLIYFLLEITIIAGLVYLELKAPDHGT